MSGDWWVFIFLMVVMKAPIAYLAGVVWYACKAPDPPEPAREPGRGTGARASAMPVAAAAARTGLARGARTGAALTRATRAWHA